MTECSRTAHEKSAREPGREPETFHDSDELTNFAVAAQQNVREGHCGESRGNPQLPQLPSLPREGEAPVSRLDGGNLIERKTPEDFY